MSLTYAASAARVFSGRTDFADRGRVVSDVLARVGLAVSRSINCENSASGLGPVTARSVQRCSELILSKSSLKYGQYHRPLNDYRRRMRENGGHTGIERPK
ncbi:unnamed protein product, partial [Iphiclides podalirius]